MSDLRVLNHLFREGIETCPACGAPIAWNRSPDGCSVEILHPYEPATGVCQPFKIFCEQLQQRAKSPSMPALDVALPRPLQRRSKLEAYARPAPFPVIYAQLDLGVGVPRLDGDVSLGTDPAEWA